MTLLDDLRAIEHKIPPSHLPTIEEVVQLLGATVLYLEHGHSFVQTLAYGGEELGQLLAASVEGINRLPTAPPAATSAAGAAAPASDPEPAPAAVPAADVESTPPAGTPDVADQLAMLHKQQEQIATAIAALQRGDVTTEAAS